MPIPSTVVQASHRFRHRWPPPRPLPCIAFSLDKIFLSRLAPSLIYLNAFDLSLSIVPSLSVSSSLSISVSAKAIVKSKSAPCTISQPVLSRLFPTPSHWLWEFEFIVGNQIVVVVVCVGRESIVFRWSLSLLSAFWFSFLSSAFILFFFYLVLPYQPRDCDGDIRLLSGTVFFCISQ